MKTAEKKFKILMDNTMLSFKHGSVVYGTASDDSDIDIMCIVDSACEPMLDDGFGQWFYQDGKFDYQFISESTWLRKIRSHEIEVFEAFSLQADDVLSGNMSAYVDLLKYDPWTMRQALSKRSNNSWAKAHKKMTIEKDYDMYCAKKSLFHSIRILDFGRQIAESGGLITYFGSVNSLWDEIRDCPETDWEFYKTRYKPLYNKKRSEMVELCAKPVNR